MIETSSEFSELSPPAREILVHGSMKSSYTNNGVIYFQEDDASRFYIVVSGYVRLSYLMEDGTAILYAIVPPGQSFGELGVFDNSFHTDTASAIGDTVVLGVRADLFHGCNPHEAEFQTALGKLISRRYRTYIDVTKSLYLSTLPGRLAESLLRLVDSLGEKECYEGRNVSLLGSVVTQSDLGAMARGTRGNVNRTLKAWEARGLIVVKNRRIIILNRAELEMVAIEDDI